MPDDSRRTFLKGIGACALGGVSVSGAASAAPPHKGKGRGGTSGRATGFPPAGITDWGDSATLGGGEISTFTAATPSGKPKFVGLHFSEGTIAELPTPAELASIGNGTVRDGGGLVAQLHGGFWSQLYDLSFPSGTPDPIEYIGFGWNSEGHLPHGVYSKPHFDIHFYFHDPEEIRTIGPQNPAPGTPDPITLGDVAEGQVPQGYELIEGGAVIPNMGAHLAPGDAPEFENRDDASGWLQTLIWGAADLDGDDSYELNFVEPMITRDFFENEVTGVHRRQIAQPETYPMDGWYPTAYSVRNLGDGGYAVVMERFERRSV